MPRTKIVCTIGPASNTPDMIRELIDAGMSVARINFSHGDHATHAKLVELVRAAAAAAGIPVAIMCDLQGPKLRVGKMTGSGIMLGQDERIKLTTVVVEGHRCNPEDAGHSAVIPVRFALLPQEVSPGDRILLDDGLLELVVEQTTDTDILCTVITGGVLKDNKGLNLPGSGLSIPALTEKDYADLDFIVTQDVDWVALSFVRSEADVRNLKDYLAEKCIDKNCPKVLAKIEKPQALEEIDTIIEAADGIMVARGDLGIEIPAEKVPLVQKRLIRLANIAGKPVITATQMLDSMIRNPRPTRAEASDVANAILDGTDAIMLSGETASGEYPLEALETMIRIANEVEVTLIHGPWAAPTYARAYKHEVTDAVSHATCETTYDLRAKAIIAATTSGMTALTISKYRPHVPIIAVTPNMLVQRQLMMSWGVLPLLSAQAVAVNEVVSNAVRTARLAGSVQVGERVVVTAGVTPNMAGTTNMMSVEVVTE